MIKYSWTTSHSTPNWRVRRWADSQKHKLSWSVSHTKAKWINLFNSHGLIGKKYKLYSFFKKANSWSKAEEIEVKRDKKRRYKKNIKKLEWPNTQDLLPTARERCLISNIDYSRTMVESVSWRPPKFDAQNLSDGSWRGHMPKTKLCA